MSGHHQDQAMVSLVVVEPWHVSMRSEKFLHAVTRSPSQPEYPPVVASDASLAKLELDPMNNVSQELHRQSSLFCRQWFHETPIDSCIID